MRSTIALIASMIAASILAFLASSAMAEALKVAVAQRGFWNSSFIEFALQQGFFKQEGLDIEILYTEGGASTLTPVVAGSIDIAMTNGTLGAIAAFAKGMPVKIISAEATGAPDAFWYARPEGASRPSRTPLERRSRSPHRGRQPISSSYSSSTRRR
jgi:NitT/TauT family transport system substrate-binding protein